MRQVILLYMFQSFAYLEYRLARDTLVRINLGSGQYDVRRGQCWERARAFQKFCLMRNLQTSGDFQIVHVTL